MLYGIHPSPPAEQINLAQASAPATASFGHSVANQLLSASSAQSAVIAQSVASIACAVPPHQLKNAPSNVLSSSV
ncbi:MAG: hypothetical protein II196_05465 [Spirochaetales bacterium]|nr:hypothetical protein [Spirochaetales bacterium]